MKVKLSSFAYRSGMAIRPPMRLWCSIVATCATRTASPRFKPLTGLDSAVQDYVRCDPAHKTFIDRVLREAQYGGHIAFGCMGGPAPLGRHG